MRLIDADKFLAYLIYSKHIDGLTCGEVKKAIEMCKVDILDKIKAEIDEIPLSEPMVSRDGLYCYGSKSITIGHFREKVLEIIDKYREGVMNETDKCG